MEIFTALGILAIVIVAGFASRKFEVLSRADALGVSAFIYYFALPALFFVKIAEMDIPGINLEIFWGSLTPLLLIVAGLGLLKILRLLTKDAFILLALAVVFGSNAFFGITFFEALRGDAGINFAVITSAVLGPIGLIATILLFEYATAAATGLKFIKKVFLNPLIISIIAGVVFSLLHLRVEFLFDGIALLGKTAGPLAIFALGTFIYDNFSLSTFKHSFPFALFRLIALPLVTFLVIQFWLQPSAEFRDLLILQSGIPAAISLAVFAERYRYRVAEISDIVILTSLGGFVVLGAAYFLI